MRKTNTGYKGIYQRNENTFEAGLTVTRKNSGRKLSIHIGSFKTPAEAVTARMKFIDSLKY